MTLLAQRLSEMTPGDSDAYLSNIWKQFRTTEAFEALMIMMLQANKEAEQALLDPNTEDRKRAHAAGQCASIKRLVTSIQAAISFDPTTAEYHQPEDEVGDNEEPPPDTFQVI
jgi:hypothetical protein